MIDKEIDEYRLAMMESIKAKKSCFNAAAVERKAHYRLLKAKDAIRFKEFDLLDENFPLR